MLHCMSIIIETSEDSRMDKRVCLVFFKISAALLKLVLRKTPI